MVWIMVMLRVKLPVVDAIHSQTKMFATFVEKKASGDSEPCALIHVC